MARSQEDEPIEIRHTPTGRESILIFISSTPSGPGLFGSSTFLRLGLRLVHSSTSIVLRRRDLGDGIFKRPRSQVLSLLLGLTIRTS